MPARVLSGAAAALALSLSATARADTEQNDALAKVIQMLSELQAKVIKEGEVAHSEYESYAEWCEDTAKETKYEISTGESEVANLKAVINKATATIAALEDRVEDLAEKAATAAKELGDATKMRKKEAGDFVAEEKELKQSISAVKRAIKVISEQGGASMVQLSRAKDVVQALGAMVQASAIDSADGERLTALVQSGAQVSVDEEGAPAAAAYDNQSGGIVEMLESMQDKAEEQMAKARETETKAKEAFELLSQSLKDEADVANAEIEEAKNDIASNKEKKGVAEGDLDVTSKDLDADKQSLDDTHKSCQTTAEDYEEGVKARDGELGALAQAKKVIQDVAGGSSFEQVSFLQAASRDGKPQALVNFMLKLAQKQQSKSLAQLAHRISSTIRIKTARGQDPFAKVKGLLTEMITKLEKEAGADATHKAYCDKENKESTAKQTDKTTEIEKLDTAIDEASSRIAVLEEEVSGLAAELSKMAKSQADYDDLFKATEKTFQENEVEAQAAIKGVQLALKVLKDYYAQNDSSSEGAAGGIIGLLETVDADFTKSLSEMQSAFNNQKQAYVAATQENEVTTTAKNQDLKFKKQEITNLEKVLKETTSDRQGVQTELDAINVYLAKIAEQCVEKAEPYEEVKARRDAEIAGLKEGLDVLENEAALVQVSRKVTRHAGVSLRGA